MRVAHRCDFNGRNGGRFTGATAGRERPGSGAAVQYRQGEAENPVVRDATNLLPRTSEYHSDFAEASGRVALRRGARSQGLCIL
eukprot:7377468-Prymnesium_polylepis.1